MRVVTPGQMKEIDSIAINNLGIPGIVLMENAALRVVDETVKALGSIFGKKVIVLAGKGNNGGDAFAVARHLFNMGAEIKVYALCKMSDITGDAKINLDILIKMEIEINEIVSNNKLDEVKSSIAAADLVMDGLLGTGLKGEVRGVMASVIMLVNESDVPVIAIDIPSGVNGETGKVSEVCIEAKTTVTFGLPKIGQLIHPGCEYVGDLKIVDIGIPETAVDNAEIQVHLITREFVCGLIPKRPGESNKGSYGKILLVTGSMGMTGAGCLTGAAALRSGAGLVYLAVPSSLAPVYDSNLIEAVTIPLEDKKKGYISKESIPQISKQLESMDVVAVGPGLSTRDETCDVVYNIIKSSKVPLVIDADGINILSKDLSVLNGHSPQMVITPHPGEMARLIGATVKEVQADRLNIALKFAKEWGVITVLKGSRTIIASPEGEVYINITGNPGMATGGTGDVLTGIISGFIGQGLDPLDASISGVYLHGLCGDNIAAIKGEYGLIASDLVEELPYVIKHIMELKK